MFKQLKEEGRILTEDWTLYDGQNVVYRPKKMSSVDLLTGNEWAWKETYRYSSIAKRLWRSKILLPLIFPANLGYRFYAHRLNEYYNCDWLMSVAA